MSRADALALKVPSFRDAWHGWFQEDPTDHEIAIGMAVAEGETRNGDSWPGPDGVPNTADDENNIGATTLRSLTLDEKNVLAKAGLAATVGPGHNQRALDAMAALRASGLPLPQGVIHCDSFTDARGLRAYFVWFASFPTLTEGYAYFIRLLCVRKDGSRKAAYDVLQNDKSTPYQMAEAMYSAGYFRGFHDPAKVYPDGKTGREKNIEAYSDIIRGCLPRVLEAIKIERAQREAKLDPGAVMNLVGLTLAEEAREAVNEARREALGNEPEDPDVA